MSEEHPKGAHTQGTAQCLISWVCLPVGVSPRIRSSFYENIIDRGGSKGACIEGDIWDTPLTSSQEKEATWGP